MRPAAALLALLILIAAAARPAAAEACRPGQWVEPSSGRILPHDDVLARAAGSGVVLLGETHDDVEHHRWQLSVLAGLVALKPRLAVGFEALPAATRPVLDRWTAGRLDEEAFLEAVAWRRVWRLPAELYLPLFHLARVHRLPMVGLNVERGFVARVGREGWAAIPAAERQGIGDPAPPSQAYVDRLARHFRAHGSEGDTRADPAFRHFIDAQLVWDRAMAEALARARDRAPLVVGIIGSEHVRHSAGVPHQLADLGVQRVTVLLPAPAAACGTLEADEADAVFLLDPPA